MLIVHSLVSRSYILDLRPGNSLVEYLTDAGLDVFMLDWGVPDELDADNDLERYVDWYLPRAIDAVRRETGCATRSRSPATAWAASSRRSTPRATRTRRCATSS